MRKITEESVEAFIQGVKFSKQNMFTDGNTLYLFGNAIARKVEGGIEISNAGWKSNTTKERLNGIPGVSVVQKRGVWYLNGNEWDGAWTKIQY